MELTGALQGDSCCDGRAASEHSPASPQAGAQNKNTPKGSDAGLGTSADKAKTEITDPSPPRDGPKPQVKRARADSHVPPSSWHFPRHDPHLPGNEGLGITPTTALC